MGALLLRCTCVCARTCVKRPHDRPYVMAGRRAARRPRSSFSSPSKVDLVIGIAQAVTWKCARARAHVSVVCFHNIGGGDFA